MHSRSFPILIAPLLGLVGLALPLGCVNTDPTVDNSATITTPSSIQEIDTAVSDTSSDVATQSVTISGRTATVDGISLSGAWVAIANTAMQQVVSETSSDASGAYTLTFIGDVGGYDMLAFYQDDDTTLISWQSFSVYDDQVEDLTFNLNLTELPIIEESDDGAAPPPSGGCYRVYFGSSWCSNHILYRYYELSGAWYCSLVYAQVGQVGCC